MDVTNKLSLARRGESWVLSFPSLGFTQSMMTFNTFDEACGHIRGLRQHEYGPLGSSVSDETWTPWTMRTGRI